MWNDMNFWETALFKILIALEVHIFKTLIYSTTVTKILNINLYLSVV